MGAAVRAEARIVASRVQTRRMQQARRLNYLTVQDVLWLNLQVTERVLPFRYADLEEAVYYQYGYGESVDLLGQAARLLGGFRRRRPFPEGNEATAFLAFAAFLSINGRRLTLGPAEALPWLERTSDPKAEDVEAVTEHVHDGPLIEKTGEHGEPDVQATLEELLERYESVVSQLRERSSSAA